MPLSLSPSAKQADKNCCPYF